MADSVTPATDTEIAWHEQQAADDHGQRWTQPEVASFLARIRQEQERKIPCAGHHLTPGYVVGCMACLAVTMDVQVRQTEGKLFAAQREIAWLQLARPIAQELSRRRAGHEPMSANGLTDLVKAFDAAQQPAGGST